MDNKLKLLTVLLLALAPTAQALGPEVGVVAPVYGYRVLNSYPHDPNAFTQGLAFDQGVVYESTGLYGKSSVRRVELETGKILQANPINSRYFAEGLTLFSGKIIQLTWRNKLGFIYDKDTLKSLDNFSYPAGLSEGWGVAHDGTKLYLSDGTATIHLLDPENFKKIGQIIVRDGRKPVDKLNELEFIAGEIFANIWMSDHIVRIAPDTGLVQGWIDLTGLRAQQTLSSAAILNGIAYDAIHKRLFVTGKLWTKIYEIELIAAAEERLLCPIKLARKPKQKDGQF